MPAPHDSVDRPRLKIGTQPAIMPPSVAYLCGDDGSPGKIEKCGHGWLLVEVWKHEIFVGRRDRPGRGDPGWIAKEYSR